MIVPHPRDRERGYPDVYTPSKSIGHSATLPMDDDAKAAALEREKAKTIGFTVDPVEPPVGHA